MSAPSRPAPTISPSTQPYWDALDAGHLVFQRCGQCGHAWLPARTECPNCLADDVGWEQASGAATLVSWVTYHLAYHPYFEDKLPYRVAVVRLAEGPRMIAGLADTVAEPPKADQALRVEVVRDDGQPLAVFHPADEDCIARKP